jgi:hypothetical protein
MRDSADAASARKGQGCHRLSINILNHPRRRNR